MSRQIKNELASHPEALNYSHPHITWLCDGVENCAPQKHINFEYKIECPANPTNLKTQFFNINEAVIQRCKEIDQERNGKKIALCHHGGIHSDILINTLHKLSIPFDVYFLNIWGINKEHYEKYGMEEIKKVKKNPIIINLSKRDFYQNHSIKSFLEFNIALPTQIAISYLLEQIPNNQYILLGEGNLNRRGNLFKNCPIIVDNKKIKIPFSYANIFYYLWAKKHQRDGEFYFYSSSREIFYSMCKLIQDTAHDSRNDSKDALRKNLITFFPEIKMRPNSTNWDNGAILENKWIRNWLLESQKTNNSITPNSNLPIATQLMNITL